MEASPPDPEQAASSRPHLFVGVDVGGTKVSVAIMLISEPPGSQGRDSVARECSFTEPSLSPTEQSGQERLLDQLGDCLERAIEGAGGEVVAVGLGIPSVIDFAAGRARASVNVPLHDAPVRDVLSTRLGLPIYVDNDATCAALAEAHDERGQLDTPNLVMLTVGTGIGGGIVIDGRPYRGATGAAAELGHMIVGLDLSRGAVASADFPRQGSLEALASGRTLDALARELAATRADSTLARLGREPSELSGHDLVDAARAGDVAAREALALIGERLGVGVANVINTFDPEVVAIGGGVSLAADHLLRPAKESAQRFVLPGVGTATEVRLARAGPHAGVRGAALLASIEHARQAGRAAASAPATARAGDTMR